VPSAFAHGWVGAALSVTLPRELRSLPVAVVFASLAAAPDLDVLGFRLSIPYAHALGHRGLTHSLPFAATVGLASWPFWMVLLRARRTRVTQDSEAWRAASTRRVQRAAWLASAMTCVAVASHGMLDLLTDAGLGVGLLLPFGDTRYFAPWRPIPTSPLAPSAFFSPRGLQILLSEIAWLGLPTALAVGVVAGLRRLRVRCG